MSVVSFRPQPLYPCGERPWYPLSRRLYRPQISSGRFWRREKSLSRAENRTIINNNNNNNNNRYRLQAVTWFPPFFCPQTPSVCIISCGEGWRSRWNGITDKITDALIHLVRALLSVRYRLYLRIRYKNSPSNSKWTTLSGLTIPLPVFLIHNDTWRVARL
jgi:hypothetical protein